MNPTGIMLILSGMIGLVLSVFGAYTVVDNLVHPQGMLFEGIVLGGLGIILLLLVTIASAIGKTMLTFVDIMKKQSELQSQLRNQGGTSLTNMLTNMMNNPPKGLTIETSGQMPESLKNLLKTYPKDSLEGLGLEELEKKLAEAIKNDDYEKAQRINKAIEKLKNQDDGDEKKD
jgi:hypothetical protein